MGRNLFKKLKLDFKNSWGLLNNEEFNEFEVGMGKIWDTKSQIVPLLMRDLAKYFLKFHVNYPNENLYYKLLDNIIKLNLLNQSFFSALNYDCIFEEIIRFLGYEVNYFSEMPKTDKEIVFWKLHGSSNFIPSNSKESNIKIDIKNQFVKYSKYASFNPDIKGVNTNDAIDFCNSDTALYPSMCIYCKGKPLQISSYLKETLINLWQRKVITSKYIIIIGIKPHPDDKHIWDPLIKTQAKLLFIGNKEKFEDWMKEYKPKANYKILSNRFEDGLPKLIKYLKLNCIHDVK